MKESGNIKTSLKFFSRYRIPKNASILDIGCNYGSLLDGLSKNGFINIKGIDINSKTIRKGRERYPSLDLQAYDGNEIPFKDETFDVVLMFDVIEHIPEVEDFLENQVNRVLKKGGRFIFQTPNKLINLPWAVIKNRSFTQHMKVHCNLQTRGSLKRLLDETGFRYVHLRKFSIDTDNNRKKLKKVLGPFGKPLIKILERMPLFLYPNFWGSCRK